MESLFEHILDDDEKIIKVFKPHKGKYYFSNLFGFVLTYLFFGFFGFAAVMAEEVGMIYTLIPLGIFVLMIILTGLLLMVYYKNNYYAYTNKRIVIRSGIFGVDYKSLDMGMIGIVDVYVSLIDKILRKNTGTVSFGSIATKEGMSHRFSHIQMPYESCKEIKSAIDKYKQKNTKVIK